MAEELTIAATYTVAGKTFSTQEEAQAYLLSQQRQKAMQKHLAKLGAIKISGTRLSTCAGPDDWSPRSTAQRMDRDPRTVLLIAAIALQGRDAEALGIPTDMAHGLKELLAAEQELD